MGKLFAAFSVLVLVALALYLAVYKDTSEQYKTVKHHSAPDGISTVVLAKGTKCVLITKSVTGGFGDSAILNVTITNLQTGATYVIHHSELTQDANETIEGAGGIGAVHPCQPRLDERDPNMQAVVELVNGQSW